MGQMATGSFSLKKVPHQAHGNFWWAAVVLVFLVCAGVLNAAFLQSIRHSALSITASTMVRTRATEAVKQDMPAPRVVQSTATEPAKQDIYPRTPVHGSRSEGSAAEKPIRMFIGVLSRADNFIARRTIRETWGADPGVARVMFFVMRPRDDDTFTDVRREAVSYGDVYVLSEVYEDYERITYSTLALFKAAALFADNFTHVVKTDDDIYVRPSLLLSALEGMPRQWLYAGYPMERGRVHRKGDYHVVPYSNWPSDMPVRYGYGSGYVLSMDLVKEIAAGVPHILMQPDNLLMVEDLATGYWVDYVRRQGVPIHYDDRITRGAGLSCKKDLMFYHITSKPKWKEMQCMHQNNGSCCSGKGAT